MLFRKPSRLIVWERKENQPLMFYMPYDETASTLRVSRIDPSTDRRWDELVAAHPMGWLYHTSHWKEILEQSFPHINACYYALEDDSGGRLQAGLPLCAVRSWLLGDRLVALPFASLFDPLVKTAGEFQVLLKGVFDRQYSPRYNYMEIRALHTAELIKDPRFRFCRAYLHHHITLDKSPQKLQKCFHRSCVRQRIRRAEKSGLGVRRGGDEGDLRSFYELYVRTRRRLHLPPQPYRFIYTIWSRLKPHGHVDLLLAERNGHDVGAVLLLKYKNRVSIEYAAYDQDAVRHSPVHLLFWNAICDAHEQGYEILDFGQTSVDNSSLATFKKRWGAQETPITTAYFHDDGVRTIPECCHYFNKAEPLCQKLPDWMYRLIGRFCYRHMG